MRELLRGALELRILPDDYLARLRTSDHYGFILRACKRRYCGLMCLELKLALTCVLDRTECYPSIPVAALDDVVALIHDQDGHVELLDAPVDLIDSILGVDARESLLSIASERKWCRRVEIMCP